MNKKIIAAVGVIALGCIGMLIWAWRSSDLVLVITMGVALTMICGVGMLPVIFNTKGHLEASQKPHATVVVKDELESQ